MFNTLLLYEVLEKDDPRVVAAMKTKVASDK